MFNKLFGTVSHYPPMLNKIALYTFGVSIAAVVLLRSQIPAIEMFLGRFSVIIPIGGLSIPLGTFLPGFLYTFVCRVIKLHDKLSDLFGIRRRFDIHEILMPLAVSAGTQLTIPQIKKIRNQRRQMMGKVFYKYISISNGKAGIDIHNVTMAFDQWSWYWILLEANSIAAIVAILLLVAGKAFPASLILIFMILIIWALQGIRASCSRYALDEVEKILSDEERRREVAEVFNAL